LIDEKYLIIWFKVISSLEAYEVKDRIA